MMGVAAQILSDDDVVNAIDRLKGTASAADVIQELAKNGNVEDSRIALRRALERNRVRLVRGLKLEPVRERELADA